MRRYLYTLIVVLSAGAVIYPNPVTRFVVFSILPRTPRLRAAIYLGGFLGSIYVC